jgi:hypothetical protein
MGRPIGAVNRQKPFTDMLRVALLSGGGRRLRVITDKLAAMAEAGDLSAIKEVGDRLDGKPSQVIERGDVQVEMLTDRELFAISRGGLPEQVDVPSYPMIAAPKPRSRLGTDLGAERFVPPNN